MTEAALALRTLAVLTLPYYWKAAFLRPTVSSLSSKELVKRRGGLMQGGEGAIFGSTFVQSGNDWWTEKT